MAVGGSVMVPFERALASSYRPSIVIFPLPVFVFTSLHGNLSFPASCLLPYISLFFFVLWEKGKVSAVGNLSFPFTSMDVTCIVLFE